MGDSPRLLYLGIAIMTLPRPSSDSLSRRRFPIRPLFHWFVAFFLLAVFGFAQSKSPIAQRTSSTISTHFARIWSIWISPVLSSIASHMIFNVYKINYISIQEITALNRHLDEFDFFISPGGGHSSSRMVKKFTGSRPDGISIDVYFQAFLSALIRCPPCRAHTPLGLGSRMVEYPPGR